MMGGTNQCLYCGNTIAKVYDYSPKGVRLDGYLHRDHMDPLSFGGEDSEENTVYCCINCNLKKGSTLYTDWLGKIPESCRKRARAVYVSEKHGKRPDEFTPKKQETKLVVTIELSELLGKL